MTKTRVRLQLADADAVVGPIKAQKEQTGAQITGGAGSLLGVLYRVMPATYATYREMRKDPTLAMGRALLCAALVGGSWSLESDDEVTEDTLKLVGDCVLKWRNLIIKNAIWGSCDFGWAGFELVFGRNSANQTVIPKVKPLLQDITVLLVAEDTGALTGYRQRSITGEDVDISVEYLLHIAFRVEGTDWHGQSLFENARAAYNKHGEADAGAARYDKKVAGSHVIIHYPLGTSTYKGAETSNEEIALILLRALESSGSVMVPDQVSEFVGPDGEAQAGWRIEILEDKGGRQPTFTARLKYLDAQKIRALLLPERSVLEGTFGTKAEAGTHVAIAITNLQMADQDIADAVNEQIIDRILEQNKGPEAVGTVRIVPAPLVDDRKELLKAVYEKVLTNPQGFLEEFGKIDLDAVKDQLGIPKAEEVTDTDEDLDAEDIPPPGSTKEELEELEKSGSP